MSNNKVPRVPGMSWNSIDQQSKIVRMTTAQYTFAKPCPILLEELLEFDLKTLYKDFSYEITSLPNGLEAMTQCNSNHIILSDETYEGLQDGDGRARFTVAHEIGHLVLHAKYLSETTSLKQGGIRLNRSSLKPYEDPEAQANAFAARFLMPTDHMITLVRNGISAWEVANLFGVSIEAARYRIQKI